MRSGPGAVLGALGLITVAGMTFGTPAQVKAVTVGVMTCDTASSFGYVLGSSRDLNCTFVPESGTPEHYAGTISKFGVDIGYVQSAVIVWTVVAPTVALPPGSLTGTYGGATASVTVAGSGSAPMCWLAAQMIRSRCNQSASKAALASMSPVVSPR
jgi:Protein of unknown function (DUF992)